MKLWDVWIYPDWDAQSGESLIEPGAEEPHAAPAHLTVDQVAARLLEEELADWGSLVNGSGTINLAVAIREHGSGQPFRLFRARLMAIQAEEVDWPEPRPAPDPKMDVPGQATGGSDRLMGQYVHFLHTPDSYRGIRHYVPKWKPLSRELSPVLSPSCHQSNG